MKQLFTFTASILFLMGICQAQDSLHNSSPNASIQKNPYTMPQVNSKEYFLEKRSSLNTTAWVLLGVGVTLGTVGTIMYENSINTDGGWNQVTNAWGGAVMMVAGSALVITSVPIFIRAGYYKRRAMDMSASLKLEPYQSGLAVKHFPSIGLSIRL